ncbi:MAG: hypothetical protein ABI478_04665 [Propionivibrio sp.]
MNSKTDSADRERDDDGVVTAILERMEEQRLPRALDLQAKVDQGQVLDDMDIAFLDRVFTECEEMKQLLERHPALEQIAGRMMGLYHAITTRALENEPKREPKREPKPV